MVVLEGSGIDLPEAEVGAVHQSGGSQGLIGALRGEQTPRNAPQIAISC